MFTELADQEILAEIGGRLKAYRLQRNVPVSELAGRAGLSPTTVVNAEAGRNPTLETVVRMLRALGRLEAIDAFLPRPAVSPMDLLERRTTRPRRHAYPRRRASPPAGGDEEPGGRAGELDVPRG